jgi:hypothetical protein
MQMVCFNARILLIGKNIEINHETFMLVLRYGAQNYISCFFGVGKNDVYAKITVITPSDLIA